MTETLPISDFFPKEPKPEYLLSLKDKSHRYFIVEQIMFNEEFTNEEKLERIKLLVCGGRYSYQKLIQDKSLYLEYQKSIAPHLSFLMTT